MYLREYFFKYQNFCDTARGSLGGILIPVNAYMKKEGRF